MFENVVRPSVYVLGDYVPGKPVEEVQREFGLSDIVVLAANENPLGTSPKALTAMCKAVLTQANLYPEGLAMDLVNKLAEINHVAPNQILCGNGLDNVITILGFTYINPGDEVIYGECTFPAYGNVCRKMGGTCVPVPMTDDDGLDLEGFAKAITPKTKMIFVCNPNNPTSTLVSREECLKLLEVVPSNVLVMFDDAYCDFVEDENYCDMLEYLEKYPNIIIGKTFSKVYGLAGERIGYIIANPEVIKYAMKVREPYPANRVAQFGALGALEDKEFYDLAVKTNSEGRRFLTEEFEKMGLKVFKGQANFLYVDIHRDAMEVFNALLPEGILIRPLTSQDRPHGLRITIGTREQNEKLVAVMKKVLAA